MCLHLPPVSVVMPCHNGEAFLGAAIESVLFQTHRVLELIIVLDSCTDGSARIARRWEARDSRIRIIYAKNRSVGKTTDDGIAAARYDWVAILHADDVWLPEKLERQLDAAQHQPGVVCWGTSGYHIDLDGERLSVSHTGPRTVAEFEDTRATGKASVLIHSSFLVRKAHLMQVGGYNACLDGCEDLDLLDRLGDLGPFLSLPDVLMERRIHEASITMHAFIKMQHMTRFIEARRRAWNAGRDFVDFDTYLDQLSQQPFWRRLRRTVRDTAHLHYRKAALAYAQHHTSAAVLHFGYAAALRPAFAFRRAWRQLTSLRAAA